MSASGTAQWFPFRRTMGGQTLRQVADRRCKKTLMLEFEIKRVNKNKQSGLLSWPVGFVGADPRFRGVSSEWPWVSAPWNGATRRCAAGSTHPLKNPARGATTPRCSPAIRCQRGWVVWGELRSQKVAMGPKCGRSTGLYRNFDAPTQQRFVPYR